MTEQAATDAFESHDRNTQIIVFAIVAGVWMLLLQGSRYQAQLSWFHYLIFGRLFLIALAIISALASWRLKWHNLLTVYFLVCMAMQASFSVLEGPRRIDYYEYIPFFVLLSTLSWNGKLSQWFMWVSPFVLLSLGIPLFFKTSFYFTSIGTFIFQFTTPVCLVFLSIIVAKINSAKFKALSENIALQKRLINSEKKKNEALSSFTSLATQVAHDIRSPLAVLRILASDAHELSKDKMEMLQTALSRMNGIAEDLLEKNWALSPVSKELSVQSLMPLIEDIVAEKKIQFKDRPGIQIKTRFKSKDLFAKIHAIEFIRVLSNAINNAAEALPENNGTIEIVASKSAQSFLIEVRDNGQGIPAEILPQLMRKGATFKKKSGSGLGLYHAKMTIEAWNGNIDLSSMPGQGTALRITLPRPVFF